MWTFFGGGGAYCSCAIKREGLILVCPESMARFLLGARNTEPWIRVDFGAQLYFCCCPRIENLCWYSCVSAGTEEEGKAVGEEGSCDDFRDAIESWLHTKMLGLDCHLRVGVALIEWREM